MMSVYGCKTKKELKSKIGMHAQDVLVETSLHGPELKQNAKLSVVGPSPYKRVWFATVVVLDWKIAEVK